MIGAGQTRYTVHPEERACFLHPRIEGMVEWAEAVRINKNRSEGSDPIIVGKVNWGSMLDELRDDGRQAVDRVEGNEQHGNGDR
jgi:hypothetical protein